MKFLGILLQPLTLVFLFLTTTKCQQAHQPLQDLGNPFKQFHNIDQFIENREKLESEFKSLLVVEDSETYSKTNLLQSLLLQSFKNNNGNVTKKCQNALGLLSAAFKNPATSSMILSMIDSFGKFGPGILQGNMKFPGNYDECLTVPLKIKGLMNKTQHCTLPLDMKSLGPVAASSGAGAAALFSSPPYWGICLPLECTNQDVFLTMQGFLETFFTTLKTYGPFLPPSVKPLVDTLLLLQNASFSESGTICRDGESKPGHKVEYDEIIFWILVSIIGLFCVLGTLWDYLVLELKLISGRKGSFDIMPEETQENQVQITKKNDQRNIFVRFILCFSMLSNGKKILSLAPSKDSVTCINGIRFLSLTWVIMGHCWAFLPPATSNMFYVYVTLMKRFSFQPILNGTFSVDTFFVLSGFLTAYLFFKRSSSKKEKSPITTVAMMYLHRYIRLTPALAILMGFATILPAYVATDGPFGVTDVQLSTCDKYWWYNLLYINNLNVDTMNCVGHVWYLANDMQFFILAPIMLYAFKKNKYFGLGACAVFMIINIGSLIGITIKDDSGILLTTMGETMADIYIKPWCRIGPYVIGLIAGYFLHDFEKESRTIKWPFVLAGWLVSAGMALSVVFGLLHFYQDGTTPTQVENVLYTAFSRNAWGLAIAWVTFACALGYGGPINTFLSWRAFAPVSRINYSAYLYHITVIQIIACNFKSFFIYSDVMFTVIYLGILIISYGVAFFASLCFEAPFIGLEKLIF